MPENVWSLDIVEHVAEVPAAEWNALAGVGYPFLRHEFLLALEASHSVCARTGWQPLHLLVKDADGILAILPLYRKQHSWGEYVFDWSWAQAYERHGLQYYPKLLNAIPFTPCTGPRLAVRDEALRQPLWEWLLPRLQMLVSEQQLSSLHLLFPAPADRLALDRLPLLQRCGVQFHWDNPGCSNFSEFLETFASRKRKNIRKEREKVQQQGISFRWLQGVEIDIASLDRFYVFYQATYLKRGQRGYLTRDFFIRLCASMPEQLLLIEAQCAGKVVAAAFFLQDAETLYGRYWGCLEEFDQLHFETCYYQGLDYCMAQGLTHFDAGAQGEHKLTRGFAPRFTYSYHWIEDVRFREAIAHFLNEEAPQVRGYLAEAQSMLPFRRG